MKHLTIGGDGPTKPKKPPYTPEPDAANKKRKSK